LFQNTRVFATSALIVMLLAQFIFLANFFGSMLKGEKAPKNPWKSGTLEWTAESPPPHGNWPEGLPSVYRGPYEYSNPDAELDYWPQNEPPKDS